MRSKLLIGSLLALSFATLGMVPAGAATKSPGLLRPEDLPGSFQQAAPPTTYATFNAVIVDGAACTETPKALDRVSGAVSVFFSRSATTALYEFVVSFVDAKAAKASFALQAKSAAAGAKCGSVGFVPPGSTAAISTVKLASVKFAKVGAGTFASTNAPPTATLPNTAVTFVQGPYVVTVGAPGVADAPTGKDLKKIVVQASRRLSAPTPIPSTTSTTTAKPLP